MRIGWTVCNVCLEAFAVTEFNKILVLLLHQVVPSKQAFQNPDDEV
jgi:hypothetical protein